MVHNVILTRRRVCVRNVLVIARSPWEPAHASYLPRTARFEDLKHEKEFVNQCKQLTELFRIAFECDSFLEGHERD